MTCFTTTESFLDFLASHSNTDCQTNHKAGHEASGLFPDMVLHTPYDVSVKEFLTLDWLELGFGEYTQNHLMLKFSQQTHELFLGDMNEGGHAVRCRLVKVTTEDILHNSREMLTWLENRAEKMWL